VAEIDPPCCWVSLVSSTGVIKPDETLLFVLPSIFCALLGTLIPFQVPADNVMVAHGIKAAFRFKEGSDLFTPKDLVELSRPGPGVANVPGDLILVPVSRYSFEDKKYVRVSSSLALCASRSPPLPARPTRVFGVCFSPDVRAQQFVFHMGSTGTSTRGERCIGNSIFSRSFCWNADPARFLARCRNRKTIYITSIETTVEPLEIPLTKGGQAFWLTSRVIAHVVPNEETKVQDIYGISVEFETESDGGKVKIATPDPPVLIGSFPTSTSDNFRYIPESGVLVFSDYVYEDGELKGVKEGDEAWDGRGTTALVYDETYVRHWDTYRGPKHQSLFSVKLAQRGAIWSLGDEFINLLTGTKHVSAQLHSRHVRFMGWGCDGFLEFSRRTVRREGRF